MFAGDPRRHPQAVAIGEIYFRRCRLRPAQVDGQAKHLDSVFEIGDDKGTILYLLGQQLGLFVERKEVGKPGQFANINAVGMRQAIAERLSTLAAKAAH